MTTEVPFLQSEAWRGVQEALGRTVVTESGDGWSYLAVLEYGKINTRLYCPYGPYISDQSKLPVAIAALKTKAKQLGAAFIRIEPTGAVSGSDLTALDMRRVARVQPTHTSVVDLTPPTDQIIASMAPTARNLHRTYLSKGLTVSTSTNPDDIFILTSLLHGVAKKTGMHAHSDAYLHTQAKTLLPTGEGLLYFVSFEGSIIASAFIYDSPTTRYYAHAAADYEHRKLNAGSIIVSQMLIDAKSKGLKSFDLCGILPDASPTLPWAGITRFKRSFGGTDVTYAGTWELPLKRINYAIYRLLLTFTKERV